MVHHILVLGGSTFMGKSLLQRLSLHKDYDIHYVNRGRNYWSNAVKNIPNIHFTYGNFLKKIKDKLKCEEYLQYLRYESNKSQSVFEFPYLVFRLPDVIGPFDDTNRFWSYVKWIQEQRKIGLQIV